MAALFLVIIIAAIISLKLLPICSEGTQIFTDFIIEHVSGSGLNKSGELTLFWLITVGGFIFLWILLYLFEKAPKYSLKSSPKKTSYNRDNLFFLCITVLPFFVYYTVYQQFSIPLLFGGIISVVCIFFKNLQVNIVVPTYILTYYGILSILSIGCHFTAAAQLSSVSLYVITFFLGTTIVILSTLFSRKKENIPFNQGILVILQCLLPGLFSVFVVDKYLYKGTIIGLPYAKGYYVFFILTTLIMIGLLLKNAFDFFQKKSAEYISVATPMIVFAYHSFCAGPMYAQPDQHHHGEQMIPFLQVFEHGHSLYDTYTPVSGLFPFVNGGIQHILLDGTVTDYAPAISITMVIFCFITMYLISRHTGNLYGLMFAVLFTLPCYNRQYMVLPLLLLLTSKKLFQKPLWWFLSYIFFSFLAGLYYPLFGAAILLAIAPFGIYQAGNLIKMKETALFHIKAKEKRLFIICSILLFLLIAVALPLLFRMLKHTLIYSSQTIAADGITLSNQATPDFFMSYLKGHDALRHYLYLGMRFLLPALGIWIAAYYLYSSLRKKEYFYSLSFLSCIITLVISYTYTLVRADTNRLLSRTGPILIAVIGIYLPIILLQNYSKLRKNDYIILGLSMSLPLLLYMQVSQTKNPDLWVYPDGESQLVMDDSKKLFSYYQVPETFLKSEDTDLPLQYQNRLGRGFMVADQLSYIKDYASVIEKCQKVNENTTYMAFDGQGFFDYLGVKCYGTGYIPAARSYKAQEKIWQSDSENLPVVFYIQPQYNYYIFRFMLDEEYIYCQADKAFYPPNLYKQLTEAGYTMSSDDYRLDTEPTDFGLSAASFGDSADSLLAAGSLTKKSSINTLSVIDGKACDGLYLEFNPEYIDKFPTAGKENLQIKITWQTTDRQSFEGSQITCQYGKGRLFIPMGMNATWLLSAIDQMTIQLTDPGTETLLYTAEYNQGTFTASSDQGMTALFYQIYAKKE